MVYLDMTLIPGRKNHCGRLTLQPLEKKNVDFDDVPKEEEVKNPHHGMSNNNNLAGQLAGRHEMPESTPFREPEESHEDMSDDNTVEKHEESHEEASDDSEGEGREESQGVTSEDHENLEERVTHIENALNAIKTTLNELSE